jgi:hypothetical protein
VADAGCSGQRRPFQNGREIAELPLGAATIDVAVHQCGDAGTVIAAIFQPAQRIQDQRRRRP